MKRSRARDPESIQFALDPPVSGIKRAKKFLPDLAPKPQKFAVR
ncbi:MAG: hypothetical protein ACKVP0_23225 [Pirellulaceae bacterium]